MQVQNSKFAFAVIAVLSLLVIGLFLYLLKPFWTVIAWAGILAFFFYPLYRRIKSVLKGKAELSALTLIILMILFVFVPLFFISLQLIYQVEDFLASFDQAFFQKLQAQASALKSHPFWGKLYQEISPYLENLQAKLSEQLSNILQSTFNLFKNFLQATFGIIFKMVLTLFTFYYFLVDGEKIVSLVQKLIPGSEEKKEEILARISLILKAVFYGTLLTALVQGVIATLIYLILGVPGYLLWGVLTAVASFIPFPGTALIWVPLGVYLLFFESLLKGIILLVACALTVAQVDNILKPFFIGGKAKLHNLLVFFSVLGGIIAFNFLGLFLGPLILGLFLSVIEIYQSFLHVQDKTE